MPFMGKHQFYLVVLSQWPIFTSSHAFQIMAEGTRKTVYELLASSAPKIASNLQKRRLIPFKSLPTQMGTVAALTYCLKQHPALLTLGVVSDCDELCWLQCRRWESTAHMCTKQWPSSSW